jgi:hypothetical protein
MDQRTMGMNKTDRAVLLVFGMIAAWMSGHAQSSKLIEGPAIGIETGEKAPSFRLKDQFGLEQSNDTLRGTNGTVLLFFRSADW